MIYACTLYMFEELHFSPITNKCFPRRFIALPRWKKVHVRLDVDDKVHGEDVRQKKVQDAGKGKCICTIKTRKENCEPRKKERKKERKRERKRENIFLILFNSR